MQPAMDSKNINVEDTVVDDNEGKDQDEKDAQDMTGSYIFFDFECMQETGIHEPNLCIAHKVCVECLDQEDATCKRCGDRERVFEGPNTQTEFCEWLFGVKVF